MLAERMGVAQLRELAGRRRQVAAHLALHELPRVSALRLSSPRSEVTVGDAHAGGAEQSGADGVAVQLRVSDGAYGYPEIVGTVKGVLALDCQRCLGPLDWPVDLLIRLAVVETETDLDNLAERFDALVAGADGITLHDVVEDEILASLPLAPMHASAAKCVPLAAPDDGQAGSVDRTNPASRDERKSSEGRETTVRPFADLKSLLRDPSAE